LNIYAESTGELAVGRDASFGLHDAYPQPKEEQDNSD